MLWAFLVCTAFVRPSRGSEAIHPETPFPPPDYPAFALHKHESGIIDLAIQFDRLGNIKKCEVKNSSAPPDLTEYAQVFVAKRWHNAKFAGKSLEFPVKYVFQGVRDFAVPHWPAIAALFRQFGVVTLTISFGANGKATNCTVKETTAPRDLTAYTRTYAEENWLDTADAGQTVTVPVVWKQRQP